MIQRTKDIIFYLFVALFICAFIGAGIYAYYDDVKQWLQSQSHSKYKVYYEKVPVRTESDLSLCYDTGEDFESGFYYVLHKKSCKHYSIQHGKDYYCNIDSFSKLLFDVYCPYCWTGEEVEYLNRISFKNNTNAISRYRRIKDSLICNGQFQDSTRKYFDWLWRNHYQLKDTILNRNYSLFYYDPVGEGMVPFDPSIHYSNYWFDGENRITSKRTRSWDKLRSNLHKD